MSEERFTRIETDLAELRSEVAVVRAEGQERGHEMRDLFDEVLDRIKAMPDPTEALRREARAERTALRAEVNRRLDPLEMTVRNHSVEFARLKGGRS